MFFPEDKQKHLLAGFSITLFSWILSFFLFGHSPIESITIALLLGIFSAISKEAYDSVTGGNVELLDILATLTGSLFSIVCIFLLTLLRF